MFRNNEFLWGNTMERVYQNITLKLILAISKALDQMERKNYAAAEELLRAAWQEASGETPKLPLR